MDTDEPLDDSSEEVKSIQHHMDVDVTEKMANAVSYGIGLLIEEITPISLCLHPNSIHCAAATKDFKWLFTGSGINRFLNSCLR